MQEPGFHGRMFYVRAVQSLCVGKGRLGFIKRDFVLGQVGGSLGRVPLKHGLSIYKNLAGSKLELTGTGGGKSLLSELSDLNGDGLRGGAVDGNGGAPFFRIVPGSKYLCLDQDRIADCNGGHVAFDRFVTV